MERVFNIMMSLVKMNDWKVDRFDIQASDLDTHDHYVAYLDFNDRTIKIRDDGTFEFIR